MKGLIMLLVLSSSSRFCFAFQPTASATRKTTLAAASFMDTISKAFSSTMSDSKTYTVGITGASGLVGTALRDELAKKGTVNGKPVRVVQMMRSNEASVDLLNKDTTVAWNPQGTSPNEVFPVASEFDAVIHLAGENIATGLGPLGFLGLRPWSDAKKAEILNSRVNSSRALSAALAATKKPVVFMAASGVGAYGNTFIGESKVAVDEQADISATEGFLAEVSRQAEAATQTTNKAARVVNMRFGVVLSTKGGALAKLAPIFRLGGGGNVGSGEQYFSFISARDIARAIVHGMETPSLKGPVNFCAPDTCTNAEFTQALGKALSRPTILPLPSFAVSLLFGEMGEETLLGGVKALPTKLLKSGFQFSHPSIDDAVVSALSEEI